MFSFCATLGAASVAWASFAFRVPHGESADRGNACTFPLYSCGSGEPCRSLQCDFGAGKVNPKTSISTSFSRFCPDFTDIYWFLSGFGQFYWPTRFSKTPRRSIRANPSSKPLIDFSAVRKAPSSSEWRQRSAHSAHRQWALAAGNVSSASARNWLQARSPQTVSCSAPTACT
jgi:hypothetical protein